METRSVPGKKKGEKVIETFCKTLLSHLTSFFSLSSTECCLYVNMFAVVVVVDAVVCF